MGLIISVLLNKSKQANLMAEPTAVLPCWMLTWKRTLCGDTCFIFVESTERNTIPFLFQGEPQVTPLLTAEPRDRSGIADPLLVSEGSATPVRKSPAFINIYFEITWQSWSHVDVYDITSVEPSLNLFIQIPFSKLPYMTGQSLL